MTNIDMTSESSAAVMDDQDAAEAEVDSTDDRASSDESTDDGAPGKLVPVQEAIRYRKRAQAAERELETLREELAGVSSRLEDTSKTLAQLEQREAVTRLLAQARAIDVDAACVLVEDLLKRGDGDETPDLDAIVCELQQSKPYLFASAFTPESNGHARKSGALRPSQREGAPVLRRAASTAVTTGRREDVLNYMRLRRTSRS